MDDILAVLGTVLVYITIVFVIAMRLGRLDFVDIAWGGAFIVAALTSFTLSPGYGILQLLVTFLVIV